MPIINMDHDTDLSWHFAVESIILQVKGDVGIILTALYKVNSRNQKSHVTTNLVHKLYHVQSVGAQPLSYFENLVSKDELAAAEAKQKSKNQTWFTMTIESLNGVLFKQELGDAATTAQRRFYEKSPNLTNWTSNRLEEWIRKAMDKVRVHYNSELKKQLSITDPKHSPHFLEQVQYHYENNDESPEMTQEKLSMDVGYVDDGLFYENQVVREVEQNSFTSRGFEVSKAQV